MTLYEYLKSKPSETEIIVCDREYEMAVYFYSNEPKNEWDIAIEDLSKMVSITKIINDYTVEVNFSELIEQKLDNIKKTGLFRWYTINHIMGCLSDMIFGCTSEEFLVKFVEALK